MYECGALTVGDFLQGLVERATDPFFSRFFMTFALWNWEVSLAIVGDLEFFEKRDFIKDYYNSHGFYNVVFLPSAVAVLLILLWPIVRGFFLQIQQFHKDRNEENLNNRRLVTKLNNVKVATDEFAHKTQNTINRAGELNSIIRDLKKERTILIERIRKIVS